MTSTINFRVIRMPVSITAFDPILSVDSFIALEDKPLALQFLNPLNENLVVSFSKMGSYIPTGRPLLSDYLVTFFNSGDLSPTYTYSYSSYGEFIYHGMEISPCGQNFVILLVNSVTPGMNTRSIFTKMLVRGSDGFLL
jgi:hypothetical protein